MLNYIIYNIYFLMAIIKILTVKSTEDEIGMHLLFIVNTYLQIL